MITAQPANQTVTVGQTGTFSVTASGTEPLMYQWQKNGTNISGATSASYTTPATMTADNGSTYRVTVSNSAGSVSSTAATLTVTAGPAITTQPANQTVVVGQMATFSVGASGASPLSYQWQSNTGSGFQNIPNATSSSYTTPLATSSDNGTMFRVTVTNSAGSVMSDVATVTVTTPPTVTTQPANQMVVVGQTATFSVVASGTPPLSYQWQSNTGSGFQNIPNATSSSYTTPLATSSDNGTMFRVMVSNSAGSVTSNAATLTVGSAATRIDFGNGFTSSGLTLNGGATINGTRLRLTDGGTSEARSAFFNTAANVQSFVTDFHFQLTNPDADGFTFTIQGNSPTALGGSGGSLGYGPNSLGTGEIAKSVAVGFQLYTTGRFSLAGVWTNGASPADTPGMDTTGSRVDLHSGDVMNAHLAYDGTTLTLQIMDTVTNATFTKTFTVNIPSIVGGNAAYVGFTGGTGVLTAIQDMLNWRYTTVPVTSFVWPADTPITYAPSANGGPNDYSTFALQSPILGQYHTGIDVCPQSTGCTIGNPVYATSSGVVELALVVNSSAFLCDGSPASGYPINADTSNLGNVLVIAHPNGKFSLYGHMECIAPGIVAGQPVAAGTRIGNMGNSAYAMQHFGFIPHVHFEMKDVALTGDSGNLGYSGYTTDVPDGYGYHDPRIYINPFSSTSIAPTAVRVDASAQNVRTGPAASFATLATVAPGQEFVAFASNGSWYQIYLPNDVAPISGWVNGLTPDAAATQLQVTGTSALTIFPTASSSAHLVSWDQTFSNCAASAHIWNGQRYVRAGSQSGFNEFYLPLNYYFSSASACAEPSGPGPSLGWADATFFH